MTSFFETITSRLWNRIVGLRRKRATDGLLIGLALEDGRLSKHNIFLPRSKRPEHQAIFGRTGTGKSSLMLSFILQDLAAGRGFAVIDVHGQLTKLILQAAADHERRLRKSFSESLVLIQPADPEFSVGLNPLENLRGQSVFSMIAEFTQVLKHRWHLDSLGARTEELLRNSLHVLADCRLTLVELAPLLTDASFRAICLRKVTNNEVRGYFESRYNAASDAMQQALSSPVLNKITGFTADPRFRHIVGQPKSTFSIPDALEQGQIILLDLSKGQLGEQALTLGSLFLAKLKTSVFGRRSRKLFTIYADEVQNLITADSGLDSLLSECRKFSIALVTANQFLDQLPTQVRSALLAISTHICFQLSSGDAQAMAAAFDGGKALAELLKNLPQRNVVMKSGAQPWRRAVVPRVAVPNADYSDLYDRCRERWARKRSEIEDEIMRRQPTAKRSAAEVINAWE